MGKLGGEMKALAKHCGGSHKMVNDRIHIVQRFDQHLRALNVQIQRVEQIKVRHIESYIHERLAHRAAVHARPSNRIIIGMCWKRPT